MRSSSGGWVEKRPLNPVPRNPDAWLSGLSMYMCAVARLAFRISLVSTRSLRSASAIPSASFVISAADASARNSRRRETASWMTTPAIGAISNEAKAMIVRIGFEPRLPPPKKAIRRRTSREQRDHADENGDERHQPDVTVTDVGDLVREHAFELPLVHQLDDARRHGDVGGLGVASGRECVRRRVLNQPQLGRLLEPRGDGDVLEQPVELRVVALLHPLGARPRADHRARREPGEDRVEEAGDRDDDEQARLKDVRERDAEHADEQREEKEQPGRPPRFAADLLLDGHDCANETSTGWSTPSPASKNSRGWNENVRAMMSVGNVCWRLLKRSTVAL